MHFQKPLEDFLQNPPFGWAILMLLILPILMFGVAFERSKLKGRTQNRGDSDTVEGTVTSIMTLMGIPLATFLSFSALHIFRAQPSFELSFCLLLALMAPIKVWNIFSVWNRINRVLYLTYQIILFVMSLYAPIFYGILISIRYELNFWQGLTVLLPVLLLTVADFLTDFELEARTIRSRFIWKCRVGTGVILYFKDEFLHSELALQTCEQALKKAISLMSVEPLDFNLEVFICPVERMNTLVESNKSSASQGYSMGDSILILDSVSNPADAIAHEIAHVLMTQRVTPSVNPVLEEGFAC